jgi:hypothetical protein
MGLVYDFLELLNDGTLPDHSETRFATKNFILDEVISKVRDGMDSPFGDLILWMLDHGIELPQPEDPVLDPDPDVFYGSDLCLLDNYRRRTWYRTDRPLDHGYGPVSYTTSVTYIDYIGGPQSGSIVMRGSGTLTYDSMEVISWDYTNTLNYQDTPCGYYVQTISTGTMPYTYFVGSTRMYGSRPTVIPAVSGWFGQRQLSAFCGSSMPSLVLNSPYMTDGDIPHIAYFQSIADEVYVTPCPPPTFDQTHENHEPVTLGRITYYYFGDRLFFPVFSNIDGISRESALTVLESHPIQYFEVPYSGPLQLDARLRSLFGDVIPPSWALGAL